jgi:putative exosortase-associated protein (TIGR04073 family)
MLNKFLVLGASFLTVVFAVGCAGPQQKLGRGMSNTYEIVRMGEMQRSVEQTALFEPPGGVTYAGGLVRGFSRTLARTGLGLYEIVTFPIPNHLNGDYDPIATRYLNPTPVYPDSYTPGLIEDPTFATDTYTGFSGGEVAPMLPGSRFRVFEN